MQEPEKSRKAKKLKVEKTSDLLAEWSSPSKVIFEPLLYVNLNYSL
jgi:hypothetical protein